MRTARYYMVREGVRTAFAVGVCVLFFVALFVGGNVLHKWLGLS